MGPPNINPIDDDTVLVRRWACGDRAAAQRLILRYASELNRFFRTQQPADADDLTQETLLAVIEGRARFRGEASFRTYLLRIARYKLWAHRRRREESHVVWEEAEDQLIGQPSAEPAPPGDGLDEALQRLSPMLSRVITLSFERKLSRDAIASELGIPPGTVASRIRTAKIRLKALLEDAEASMGVKLHL